MESFSKMRHASEESKGWITDSVSARAKREAFLQKQKSHRSSFLGWLSRKLAPLRYGPVRLGEVYKHSLGQSREIAIQIPFSNTVWLLQWSVGKQWISNQDKH